MSTKPTKFQLDQADQANNAAALNECLHLAALSIEPNPGSEQIAQAKVLLTKFLNEQAITLLNLLESEQTIFLDKVLAVVKNPAPEQITHALLPWAAKLHHAQAGRGVHVERHRQASSSMAADLLKTKAVAVTVWGTDLDIFYCLNGYLKDPRTIDAAGTYILSPISLTESLHIADVLNEALAAVIKKNVQERVLLQIPVNGGNSHWRLAKIEISQQAITAATLWDSLASSPASIQTTNAYRNLTKAVQKTSPSLKPVVECARIQTNGYSCMDYVIQAACQTAGIKPDIARAKSPTTLRLAVLKEIAQQHPHLGAEVANQLVLTPIGTIEAKEAVVKNKPIEPAALEAQQAIEQRLARIHQSASHTKEDKAWQIKFDAMFAQHLQHAYNTATGCADEAQIVQQAQGLTVREMGFFTLGKNRAVDLHSEETAALRVVK